MSSCKPYLNMQVNSPQDFKRAYIHKIYINVTYFKF